jgi:hypothetical protein
MFTYLRSQLCYWCEKHRHNLKQKNDFRVLFLKLPKYFKTVFFGTYMFCKSIIVPTQTENQITSLSYIDAISNMLK